MKPKEQTKLTEDESNNQPKATTIFNELINKRKEIMSELYDSIDYNNLKFEYVAQTESFYGHMNFKELFNTKKNNQIKFSEVKNKQNEFLNKLSNIKFAKRTVEQKEVINNLENFYNSREEVINFLRDNIENIEMLSDANYNARKNKTEGKGLK